jgi:hypothetical protein
MMKLGQEGSDWLSDQIAVAGHHELHRGLIGHLDKPAIVNGNNCGRARLDQYSHPFLSLETEPFVSDYLESQ